jgi:hypothetical protein
MIKRAYYAALSSSLLLPVIAMAGAKDEACTAAGGTLVNGACEGGTKLFGPGSIFQSIANTLIFVIGAVAVLMVIIGGLRYVLSGGDSAGVKSAKDTILYALIGVIVAALAYALVQFVIGKV